MSSITLKLQQQKFEKDLLTSSISSLFCADTEERREVARLSIRLAMSARDPGIKGQMH